MHVFARARARRGRGDQIQIAARFKLLLQNGRVKHRGLLRVISEMIEHNSMEEKIR